MEKWNLDELFKKALEICDAEEIPYRKINSIKANNRLTKSWGRCLTRYHTEFDIEVRGKILNKSLFPDERGIMEVILHEIIHTCPDCWNHGALFKEYGGRLEKYGYNVGSATTNPEKLGADSIAYSAAFRYMVKCPKCGYTIGKDKMCDLIKYPSIYSHTPCGNDSHFVRIR